MRRNSSERLVKKNKERKNSDIGYYGSHSQIHARLVKRLFYRGYFSLGFLQFKHRKFD